VPRRGRRAPSRRLFAEPLAAKVPEITAWFWVVKILTTAAGEATSDALKTLGNIKGGGVEVLLFAIGILLQFRSRRYTAIAYWFLAYAIATFGTGVADFLHLDVGIPYAGTTLMWAVILAAVFIVWYRSEGTLSIHSVHTTRRELFYWATVFATFALGTALGDFTASELGLGYLASAILFSVVILVPAAAYRWFGMNSIAAFWFAYVVTRPLGASYADYISKPSSLSGIGFGDAQTALVLGLAMAACVVYLAVFRPDVQVTLATQNGDQGDDAVLVARSGPAGDLRSRDDGTSGLGAIPGPTGAPLDDDWDMASDRGFSGDPGMGGSRDPQDPPATPGRRYLGGWPRRQPADADMPDRGAGAGAPAPPVSPRHPRSDVGAVRNVRARPPSPPTPPDRSRPARPSAPAPAAPHEPAASRISASSDRPQTEGSGRQPPAPPLRPRSPGSGPPPVGGRTPRRATTEKPEKFDPLLRDLLAWGLVEPGQPADDNATWHLADDARHRLEDLHTQAETRQSQVVYFDRVCAGCRRRQLTRRHDGTYLCDACFAHAQTPAVGTPAGDQRTPRTQGTGRTERHDR
jgi:uncharacterized membrane-anchored protein